MEVLQVSVMCYCVFVVCLVLFNTSRQKYIVSYIVHLLINVISLNVK